MILGIFIKKVILSALNILNSASVWLVISFLFAGIFREFVSPRKLQKMLGNNKISSILKSTISGMLLPICSCGVIPIGFSLYYSGAFLGPTLAFMTSTPIINPIAVVLCYGLLGKQITIMYVVSGFTVPFVVGIMGNKFGGREIQVPGISDMSENVELEETEKKSFSEKIMYGIIWSFSDISLVVSKYVIYGMLLAGILLNIFPQEYITQFLGNPSLLSLGSITILATIMYVCAVGHIPFVAALIATGAAPGIAITFLMAGAATNLPELMSMSKVIGKRAVLIYSGTLVTMSIFFGYLTNILLMPNFTPVIDFDRTTSTIKIANAMIVSAPPFVRYSCSLVIIFLGLKALYPEFMEKIRKSRGAYEN